MPEITFVDVESETVEVKEECAEEEDPLRESICTKGKNILLFFSYLFLCLIRINLLTPIMHLLHDCLILGNK